MLGGAAVARACAFADAEWLELGGVLPLVGYSAAGVRGMLATDMDARGVTASAAAGRTEGQLMRLPLQWFRRSNR